MENSWARVTATMMIWAAFAIVMGMVAGNLTSDGSLVFLTAIMMIGAAGATSAVWLAGRSSSTQPAESAMEKAKRAKSMRVSRIVDSLSDDELDQLRARLEEREESVPLESLMSRNQKQQQ